MDNFLNSEEFEAMAREYNKKYSQISVLQIDDMDRGKIEKLFSTIYKFMSMMKYCYNFNLRDLFDRGEKILCYIEELEKNWEVNCKKVYEKNQVKTDLKNFSLVILEIIKQLFDRNLRKNERIEKLFYMFLDLINDFFCRF